jgi:hypothetical protein
LAAGEATRLPNKPLLPIHDGRIVIESALRFLQPLVDNIVVVVQPDSLVQKVLISRGWDLTYAMQPSALGTPDALSRAAPYVKGYAIITFSDNIYDMDEVGELDGSVAVPNARPVASVRDVPKAYEKELDAWRRRGAGDSDWVPREMRKQGDKSFAGWITSYPNLMARGLPDKSALSWLVEHNAQACDLRAKYKWCDVGTTAAYSAYIERGDS